MWEALREAIDEEMEKDPTVLVMGALACSDRPCCMHDTEETRSSCSCMKPDSATKPAMRKCMCA